MFKFLFSQSSCKRCGHDLPHEDAGAGSISRQQVSEASCAGAALRDEGRFREGAAGRG